MPKNIRIQEISNMNRPRERLLTKGESSLSDAELLAIIFRTGSKDKSAVDLGHETLMRFGNLKNAFLAPINHMLEINGIGNAKAITIKAVYEIAKRIQFSKEIYGIEVHNPKEIYEFIKSDIYDKTQEYLYLLSLDSRRKIIAKDLICIGSVNETLVPNREILIKALSRNAVNIILIHNHPSENPEPSYEDILVTKNLKEASDKVGIRLLDHIVATNNRYISMKEHKLVAI